MGAPTIYYYGANRVCHELKPNADGSSWRSADNFSARKGYKQVILSNPAGGDIRGIPGNLDSYADVFVRQDTGEVLLFAESTGKDSSGRDISHYKNLLCQAGESTTLGDHDEHIAVSGDGEQGIRILVELNKVISPESTVLTELDSDRKHNFARYMILPSKTSRYEIGFKMDGQKYRAPINDGTPGDHVIILMKFKDGKPVKFKLQNEEWPAEDNVRPILTPVQQADAILNSGRLSPLVKKVASFGKDGDEILGKLKDKLVEIISSSGTPNIDKIEAKLKEFIDRLEKKYGPIVTAETVLNDKDIAPLIAQLNALGEKGQSKVKALRIKVDSEIASSRKPDIGFLIGFLKGKLENWIKELTPVAVPAPAVVVTQPAQPPATPQPAVASALTGEETPYPTIDEGQPTAPAVPPIAAAPQAAPAPTAPPAPVPAKPAPAAKKSPYEEFILRYHQFTRFIDGYHNNTLTDDHPLDIITSAYGKLNPYLDETSETSIKDDGEFIIAKNYIAAATRELAFVTMLVEGEKVTRTTPDKLSTEVASTLNGLRAAPTVYKEPIARLTNLAKLVDDFIKKQAERVEQVEDERKDEKSEGTFKLAYYKKFSDILKEAGNPILPGVRVMDEFDFPTGLGENAVHNPIYYMVVEKETDLDAAFRPLETAFPLSQWVYYFANADDAIKIDRFQSDVIETLALGDPPENGDRYIFWVTREAAERIEKAPGVQDVTTHGEITLKEALKTRIVKAFESISKKLKEIEQLMPVSPN